MVVLNAHREFSSVADITFVADVVMADMVCGRYGYSPNWLDAQDCLQNHRLKLA